MELTPAQKQDIKAQLELLVTELEQSIEDVKPSSQPVELDQQAVGRVSRIDAIQQQQLQLASLQRMKQRLGMVKEALEKIDSEDFGYCLKCEEPIGFERLKARPESQACMECMKKA